MNTKYISKIFSGAMFSGILMLALFGISASNVMAQTITVDKVVCDNIGQRDTCNGANADLAGETILFSVTNITTNTNVVGTSISVTINQGLDSKANSGTTTVDSEFAAGTVVRVCEVNTRSDFDTVPRPGDSTGGQQTAGGPGFEDCIVATLGPGNNVFKFINDKIELGPSAATAMVAGRILTDNNASLRRSVSVTILNTRTLETQTVMANRLGYYQFDDLQVGDTYIITVRSRGYTFTPETISLSEDSSLNMFGRVSESPRTKGRGRIF